MDINRNQDGEYTKHYYADALRIASKLGTGFSGNLCDSTTVIENTYPGYLSNRMTIQYDEIREEINETSEIGDDLNDIYGIPYPNFCNLSGNQAQETDLFYYHPDHLGSTGMVTDINANILQGFLYAPFGEIVNEYSGLNYNVIPKFTFNAKQYDEENNMYYYSARYYAPPTFISRDPMFEKKPSISPYAYCANNPVLFVDPTGKDEYAFDELGKITWKAKSDVDVFYKVDKDGNKIEGTTLTLNKKVVTGQITLTGKDGTAVNYLKVRGDDEAKQIFEHLANNSVGSKTEYGLARIGDKSGENGRNMIGSNVKHIDGVTNANRTLLETGYTIREANHNHPSDNNSSSEGDIGVAKLIQGKFPQAKFNNYTISHGYTPYDKNSSTIIELPAIIVKP